ncbi:ferritin-like domain-containing protein [Azospirillum sp.]|uniref:ferritin-like domain-containing protein n=1 Tax=Azospirillum sp. TaxID=34012 RepID=UPI0026172042|nr:ferritin-like domain-containing protein [Azospirillum sp.]
MSNHLITTLASVTLPNADLGRRTLFRQTGKAMLSAAAVAMIGGVAMPAGSALAAPMQGDVDILNVALGLEHEAITAYQIGAESGLVKGKALDAAKLFQSHHKGHRDALVSTIEKMGGKPVAPKSQADVAKALNAGSLKTQDDVLRLAAKLELGAANAYLGVIPSFSEGMLKQVAARLAADETMHWTALSGVLGLPLPTGPLSFGA